MIKKIWNDPVWSKIISAAILGLIVWVSSLIPNLWASIGSLVRKIAVTATSDITVPLYVLCLLGLGSAIIVLIILIAIKDRFTNSPPSFLNYNSDTFFGLTWRWRYDETAAGKSVSYLTSYCAKCDYQVYGRLRHTLDGVRVTYYCESCEEEVASIQQTDQTVQNRVERFILQKLRQNTFS